MDTQPMAPASLVTDPLSSGIQGPPRAFGEFEVLEKIARGGMGVVYKARDRTLDRVVALKVLIEGPDAGAEARERFEREGRAAARLHHPHIVPVHRAGVHEGCPYIAMAYIEGETLAAQMRRVVFREAAALELAAALADALDYAHAQGVVHRDVKPGNVIVDVAGRPQLMDFGLAKDLEASDAMTRTGAILGTLHYMAPEQAGGGARAVDGRTDVYALGVILYEIATGRVPFQGASALEIIHKISSGDLVPPRRLNRNISRDYETICLKCMRSDPADRYARASDLAEDLRRCSRGEPIRARPLTSTRKLGRWLSRRRRALGWAAAFAVVLSEAAVFPLSDLYLERLGLHDAADQRRYAEARESLRLAAKEKLHQAEQARRERARALNDQAGDLAVRGREPNLVRRAVALHTQAIQEDSTLAESWALRARAHFRLGAYDRAREDAARLMALDPRRNDGAYLAAFSLLQRIARGLEGREDPDELRVELRRDLDGLIQTLETGWPESAETGLARAFYLVLRGVQLERVAGLIDQAQAQDPALPEIYYLRGGVRSGFPFGRDIRDEVSDDVWAWRERSLDAPGAREDARRFLDLEPFSRDGHLLLIHLSEVEGDLEAARECASRALSILPDDVLLLERYGTFSFYLERHEAAQEALSRAGTDPDVGDFSSRMLTLALAYYATGRKTLAIDLLGSSLPRMRGNVAMLSHLLWSSMLFESGAEDRARSALDDPRAEGLFTDVAAAPWLEVLAALKGPPRELLLSGVQGGERIFELPYAGRAVVLQIEALREATPAFHKLVDGLTLRSRSTSELGYMLAFLMHPGRDGLREAMGRLGERSQRLHGATAADVVGIMHYFSRLSREFALELRGTLRNATDYYLRACARYRTGRVKEAWEDLMALRKLDPAHRGARLGLALIRARQGKAEAALRHLCEAALLGGVDTAELRRDPEFAGVVALPAFARIESLLGSQD